MIPAPITRRRVGLGAGVRFETAREFAVYLQSGGAWRAVAGWRDGAVLAADGAIDPAVAARFAATAAGLTMGRADVDAIRADVARFRLIEYGDAGDAVRETEFALAAGPADIDAAIEDEEAYLSVLIRVRTEAGDTDGVMEVRLPNGRMETYFSPAALDRRVAEVRARIVWFQAAASGNALPGLTVW